jgi:DNA transposition AAA+ family ATPase
LEAKRLTGPGFSATLGNGFSSAVVPEAKASTSLGGSTPDRSKLFGSTARGRSFRSSQLYLPHRPRETSQKGLEQLRAISDAGGIGLVLIGMPGLERRLA